MSVQYKTAQLKIDAVIPRIRVVNLTKTYKREKGAGTVVPVNNISLDVGADEMVVLLGPSGCGKTTLLRCVAGLEKPDSGEIYINDQLVYSSEKGVFLPPHLRPVSMVFQSYALWPHMSVSENVAYPLESRQSGNATEIKTRVNEVLKTMGLDHLSAQYPGQLSGGQQQRVALARAVVAGTGVVLFDEPLSNVDAKVREQLRFEIRKMQRQLKFSALYVTHDQVEAMAVADRIAVLNDGRIAQLGSSEAIYDKPDSRYVASFIGGANVLEGKIVSVDPASIMVETAIGKLRVSSESLGTGVKASVNEEVDIVIRPELIEFSRGAGGDNELDCNVEAGTFLGTYFEYLTTVGATKLRIHAPTSQRYDDGALAKIRLSERSLRAIHREVKWL